MKRRQFIETSLTGISAAAVSGWNRPAVSAETDFPTLPFSSDPLALRPLTPLIKTTRIGLGTGVHGGMRQCNLTRMDRSNAIDIIRYCYDSGIRYFDMADMYGTHELVAEALAGKPRDSYVLGSKIWCHQGGIPDKDRPTADILIERFLKELKTDYIDLVQLHCMFNDRWEKAVGYQFEPLETLKQKGLIRAHGVSCHSLAAASMAAEMPWIDVIHLRLNPFGVNTEGTWEQNLEITRKARRNGKGIIAMKVLGEGQLKNDEDRKKSTDAVTREDSINMMIVGFEKHEHVDVFIRNVAETLKDMEAADKSAA